MSSDEKTIPPDEEIEEGEIDFSSLSSKEKDDLILEMQAEEMMQKQRKQQLTDKVTDALPPKVRVKKRRRKERPPSAAKLHPGFGRVVIRMGAAMAFSFAFILIGPILFFMGIIGRIGEKMWVNAIFGIIGVLLTIAAWFLFRYIIKD
ncbi:MAG: hypothetical protein FK733_09665 [Asgard group archaeon]|nr:hypothetical protein [Asgard group archaeon]